MILNKKNIKDIKLKVEIMDVGNDTQVKLQELSLNQQLDNEASKLAGKDFVLSMIQSCCLDDDDQPLFDSVDDIKNLPADLTVNIFHACLKINNMGGNNLEELAKN